jgi:hypothetical protein
MVLKAIFAERENGLFFDQLFKPTCFLSILPVVDHSNQFLVLNQL